MTRHIGGGQADIGFGVAADAGHATFDAVRSTSGDSGLNGDSCIHETLGVDTDG